MPSFETRVLRLTDLAGVDERWETRAASADAIVNASWSRISGWKSAPGFQDSIPYRVIPATPRWGPSPYGNIRSIAWFAIHGGNRQLLLWEDNDKLNVFNGSDQSWTTLDSSRTLDEAARFRTQYATFGNTIYIVNGVDEPRAFDGSQYRRAGFGVTPNVPDLWGPDEGFDEYSTIPTLGLGPAVSTGGTVDNPALYSYVCTFVNQLGQESTISTPATVSFDNEFAFPGTRHYIGVTLPEGPLGTTGRIVYRGSDTAALTGVSDYRTYYFLNFIPDNVTDTYVDVIPDAGLGSQIVSSDFGNWPVDATLIANFQNRLWLAGMSAESSTVRYSAPLAPENFPPDNRVVIGSNDSGAITGLGQFRGSLIVFKERGVYLVRETELGVFRSNILATDVGCSSPDTIVDIPGVGLSFCGNEGVFVLSGGVDTEQMTAQKINLSEVLPQTWERVNKSALVRAHATLDRARGEYLLYVPVDGQSQPTLCLVYSYIRGGWSTREFAAGCSATAADHRGYVYIGSWDVVNTPGVWVASEGVSPPAMSWSSSWLDFGKLYQRVQVTGVTLHILGYGENTTTLQYYRDRDLDTVHDAQSQWREADNPTGQQDWGRWDDAVWGTDKWRTLRPVTTRFSVSTRCSELKFKVSSFKRCWILGAEVHLSTGKTIAIKSIDSLVGG